MPRIRSIKPSFFTDGTIVALDPLTRLAFIGLWCHADRAGRLEDRPIDLKIRILPGDAVDMGEHLLCLVSAGLIVRYEAPLSIRKGDTGRFIQIVNFEKHQRPHQGELASVLPPPQGVPKVTLKSPDVSAEQEVSTSEALREALRETEKNLGQSTESTDRMEGVRVNLEWSSLFNAFWGKYPRKVAKQAAFKAWMKLAPKKFPVMPKINGIAMILSERIQRDWKGRDLDKIPHASTFLHAEEFEEVGDE